MIIYQNPLQAHIFADRHGLAAGASRRAGEVVLGDAPFGELEATGRLDDYHLLYATRADPLRRQSRSSLLLFGVDRGDPVGTGAVIVSFCLVSTGIGVLLAFAGAAIGLAIYALRRSLTA